MRPIGLALVGALAWVSVSAFAQAAEPRAMIRLAEDDATPKAATLGDLAWLEGTWTGNMNGVAVEHVILESAFGQMPSFVRALGGSEIVFYEIAVFTEVEGSVSYRVKHFTPALAGWEAQDAYVDRPLLDRNGTTLHFDGITFERTGADSFTVYFLERRTDGSEGQTLVIPFRRRQ